MRILVSGFEPFGTNAENPTQALLHLLPKRIGECEVDTVLLPVEFARAGTVLCDAIDALQPRAVLSLGLAASRDKISVERVALNLMDARIPDNAGAQPVDQSIVLGAPDAFFATIAPRRVAAAIERSGVPAALSATAGLYVCNAVYYASLYHAIMHNNSYHALFIHVPMQNAEELINPITCAMKEMIEICGESE